MIKNLANYINIALPNWVCPLRSKLKILSTDKRGEGYLDMAMKILIVVVVGAAILAIMNTAMPTLFQNLINKVSNELTSIDVLE